MRYHIWTIGCQMNVADSQRVAAGLERLGYQPAGSAYDADVVILNTCVVRQQPEDKAVGRLNQLKRFKEQHLGTDGVYGGCQGRLAAASALPLGGPLPPPL